LPNDFHGILFAMAGEPMDEIDDIADLNEALCELPARPADPIRGMRAVLAVLEAGIRGDLSYTVPPVEVPAFDKADWPTGPDHVLIAWCDDHDGITLYMVPLTEVDDLDALLLNHGSWFADSVGGETYARTLRLMACLGQSRANDAEDFFDRWVGDLEPSDELPTVEELERLWKCWAPYSVIEMSQLRCRFLAVVSVLRTR